MLDDDLQIKRCLGTGVQYFVRIEKVLKTVVQYFVDDGFRNFFVKYNHRLRNTALRFPKGDQIGNWRLQKNAHLFPEIDKIGNHRPHENRIPVSTSHYI